MHVHMYLEMHACFSIGNMNICIYLHLFLYMYIHLHTYIILHIHIYIVVYTHTHMRIRAFVNRHTDHSRYRPGAPVKQVLEVSDTRIPRVPPYATLKEPPPNTFRRVCA